MILFNENEWSIAVPPGESIFARQYDHLSREIVVEGAPSDWQFYMLVETSGHHDTIFLSPVQNGIGVTLTREMLSFSGAYYIQLKGVKDEIERHTNVVQTYIPSSLSGEADWPDIPSEFEQIEQRIHELNTHPPYPGDGGFWMVWDVDRNEYFQSELPLPPVAVGPPGQAATIRIKETVTGESGTEAKVENIGNENAAVFRFTIPMGETGPTGKTPDISVEVSSLSSDSEPTVTVTGTPEKPVIAIGIPRGQDGTKGDPGDKGDPGSPGQTPNITIGIIETLPEGSEVTASITGETPNLILNLGIPKGRDGTEGEPGQAATIQITETETVSSDIPAAMIEVEGSTAQNRKYKAQIPRGQQGPAGEGVPSTEGLPDDYVLTPAGWAKPSGGFSATVEIVPAEDQNTWTVPVSKKYIILPMGGNAHIDGTNKAGSSVLVYEGIGVTVINYGEIYVVSYARNPNDHLLSEMYVQSDTCSVTLYRTSENTGAYKVVKTNA